jgi:hypothetical protein
LTLRELVLMADARAEEAWGRQSWLMALIANANRDPKKGRVFHPRDFNPYQALHRSSDEPVMQVGIEVLKSVFVDRRPGEVR